MKSMTHEEAVSSGLAEGYLLNHLEPTTRAAFEDHLFGCPACAQDVKETNDFIDAFRRATV